MPQPTFQFTVAEVFYIKPPVDCAILVGTVQDGAVKAGDAATVECTGGSVSVVVEGIEAFKQGDVKQATKGEQVGLKLRGITKNQPSKGDRESRGHLCRCVFFSGLEAVVPGAHTMGQAMHHVMKG